MSTPAPATGRPEPGRRRYATLRVEGRLYGFEAGQVQEVLGPMPLTSLEDGIRKTLTIFRKLQSEGRLDTADLDE